MKKEFNYTVVNKVEALEEMNFAVTAFLDECNVAEPVIFKTNLVLEELITNIIKYGLEGKSDIHSIQVSITLNEGNEIYIRIEDNGDEFNPLLADTPDTNIPVEDMKVGGLGLHLVKSMTNKIEYTRVDSMNIQQIWLNE